MQSLKGITSVNILRSTYFTFICSLLRHGILFWGGDKESKKKIVELQKQVRRSVCNI